jgi:hypothetical protein
MKVRGAKAAFLKRLGVTGAALKGVTPSAGVGAMLVFYEQERADGCDPGGDGDMLLFQWGVYDWGDGPAFEVSITRQFIEADAEEEEPRQLALVYRFDPALAPKGLKDGSAWCESPGGLAAFRKTVEQSRALKAVGGQITASVELRFGRT